MFFIANALADAERIVTRSNFPCVMNAATILNANGLTARLPKQSRQ